MIDRYLLTKGTNSRRCGADASTATFTLSIFGSAGGLSNVATGVNN